MAVSETDSSDGNSDSSHDSVKHLERKERMFSKVIVRRLPPSMNKDSFLTHVAPLPEYDYIYFVRADISLGEAAFARAYINFKNSNDIFIFKEKFDNYIFLDAKGNEYAAVVEFAPFSRIPRKRNKIRTDLKCGTIESDPVYMEFLESLKESSSEVESKVEYNIQPSLDEDKKIVNTPLLDYIKQRRIDRQKMKEEKREERKRKELERKRLKEEERRRKKEHTTRSISKSSGEVTKSVQILNSAKEQSETGDDTKLESDIKMKSRKSDKYSYKIEKSYTKEYDRRPIAKLDKDARRHSDDIRKPLSRTRRTFNDKYENSHAEYRNKKDINFRTRKPLDSQKETDDKVTEKKVKKYSERREDRKNELRKQESLKEKEQNKSNDSDKQSDPKMKSDENTKKESVVVEGKQEIKQNESCIEKLETKENKKDIDPRTQRRIRNKDRPTMALYQPGMLSRNKKHPDNDSDLQKNEKEEMEQFQ